LTSGDLPRRNRLVALIWLAIFLALFVSAVLLALRGPLARRASGLWGGVGPPQIELADAGGDVSSGGSGPLRQSGWGPAREGT
jgi:hypothetical protein